LNKTKKNRICLFFSLDKELVRLVEERRAKEVAENKNKATTNEIQVKPIIETIPTTTPAASSLVKTNNDEKVDDLLK